MKKIALSQSNYIPWQGYFKMISQVDEFYFLDQVQFTKRDWRNRNKIKTPQGLLWLTVPVATKGKYDQKVSEVEISEKNWWKKHLKSIEMNYKKAKGFEKNFPLIESIYHETSSENLLSVVNQKMTKGFCKILGVDTKIGDSPDLGDDDPNERLIHLCKELGAGVYLSGPAAKDYMDVEKFQENGINVEWMDYSGSIDYSQLHGEFDPYVSIVDFILNQDSLDSNYFTK